MPKRQPSSDEGEADMNDSEILEPALELPLPSILQKKQKKPLPKGYKCFGCGAIELHAIYGNHLM